MGGRTSKKFGEALAGLSPSLGLARRACRAAPQTEEGGNI
jgi:hypothetical protein